MVDIVPFKPKLPEIVDESGNVVEGPAMDEVIKLITGISQNAQLARIHRDLARRQIEGSVHQETLSAIPTVQFYDPTDNGDKKPWAKAEFVNNGPGPAYIAINKFYHYVKILQFAAPFCVDFTEADKRISSVFYYCDPNLTASIQVVAIR
jgi:hypothetical protein